MGNDEERTGGTVGSDQVDMGSEGDAQETASEAAPDVTQGTTAVAPSGDSQPTQKAAQVDAEVDTTKKKKKKDMGIGTSRGIETMFRTTSLIACPSRM